LRASSSRSSGNESSRNAARSRGVAPLVDHVLEEDRQQPGVVGVRMGEEDVANPRLLDRRPHQPERAGACGELCNSSIFMEPSSTGRPHRSKRP